MSTIGNYVVLLMLFIYVFALLGMSLFAGKIKIDSNDLLDLQFGVSPRANFDTLQWACISIFEVLIGENWNSLMYDSMRSVGEVTCIYYIALVLFGNIVMLNLFLAILLGNFEKARDCGQKKKIFNGFKVCKDKGMNLNDTIDLLMPDLAYHVKVKILGWEKELLQY